VRITAQLIDASTGYHLWAERYDRDLQDIFALQDEVTQKIVGALAVKLTAGEQARLVHKYTDNLEAYDYYLRGDASYYPLTKDTLGQARQMYKKATELDPQFAAAYASLSTTYLMEWDLQWSEDPQALERALELAQKAIALDDSLPQAHMVLGGVYMCKRQHEQAIAEAERAIFLDPNYANAYARLGLILNYVGRPEETLELVEKAMRLNPHYPAHYIFTIGHTHYLMRRYEEAVAALKRVLYRNPDNLSAHSYLAAIYSELDRQEEARAEVAEILRISPNYSLEAARQRSLYKDQAILERHLDGLHKAGLR